VANGSNLLLPSLGYKGKTQNMEAAVISATFTRTLENVLVNIVDITRVKPFSKNGLLQLNNESSRFPQNVGINLLNHAASDPTRKASFKITNI
jgi:hypothetical protein